MGVTEVEDELDEQEIAKRLLGKTPRERMDLPRKHWNLTQTDHSMPIKINRILHELREKHGIIVEPFLGPVNGEDAPGYYEMITTPMDVSLVQRRCSAGVYSYIDGDKLFKSDMHLICKNCQEYNVPNSDIWKTAEFFKSKFNDVYNKRFGLRIDTDKGKNTSPDTNTYFALCIFEKDAYHVFNYMTMIERS